MEGLSIKGETSCRVKLAEDGKGHLEHNPNVNLWLIRGVRNIRVLWGTDPPQFYCDFKIPMSHFDKIISLMVSRD